jgi:hypothetical protein
VCPSVNVSTDLMTAMFTGAEAVAWYTVMLAGIKRRRRGGDMRRWRIAGSFIQMIVVKPCVPPNSGPVVQAWFDGVCLHFLEIKTADTRALSLARTLRI